MKSEAEVREVFHLFIWWVESEGPREVDDVPLELATLIAMLGWVLEHEAVANMGGFIDKLRAEKAKAIQSN